MDSVVYPDNKHDSASKYGGNLTPAATWTTWHVMLSEMTWKDKYCPIRLSMSLEESNNRKQNGGTRGWGGMRAELVFPGDRVSVGDDEKVLEVDGGDGGATCVCA